jgi:hypothetical protein
VTGRACIANQGEVEPYSILIEKPEGKKSASKPKCRQVDNIKMGFERQRIGQYGLE